jgi:hypothetical protein
VEYCQNQTGLQAASKLPRMEELENQTLHVGGEMPDPLGEHNLPILVQPTRPQHLRKLQ